MKMMFLLVSTLALLLSAAVASPTHNPQDNRNRIIDLAEEYNKSLSQDIFVDDVLQDANGCNDAFLCKVHDILHKHQHHLGDRKEENGLVRNLKMILPMNCGALTKELKPSGERITIIALVEKLSSCIKQINLLDTGAKKSSD